MSSSGAPEPAEFDEDADGPDLGGEAGELLASPREYILSIVAGSVLSIVTFAIATGFDIYLGLRSSRARAGGALTSDVGTLWSTAANLVALPIRLSGELAAAAGVFAPVVAAGAFALTAAISGVVAWGLYRALVIVT